MSFQHTPKSSQQMNGSNGRKCFVDTSKSDLSLRLSSLPSASGKDATGRINYSNKVTPNFKEIVHRVSSFSTTAKRKIDYEESNIKRRKLTYGLIDIIPMYNNYQLLGDSQFVRFSEQILGYSIDYSTKLRCMGYCVSGQKIEELRYKLSDNKLPINSQVIVMIGTNDLVYKSNYTLMCKSYQRMISFLKRKCTKIILLTVPPVPKMERDLYHWTKLENFNKFIIGNGDGKQVTVVDLCSLFVSYNNTVCKDYFESVYNSGPRVDLIHLNRKGFRLLQALLDMHLKET